MSTAVCHYRVSEHEGSHATLHAWFDRPINGLHHFQMNFVDVPTDNVDAFFVGRVKGRIIQDAGGFRTEDGQSLLEVVKED